MRKKLEGNGLWESSRMMLPEHKEQIMKHNSKLTLTIRPLLDDQKLQEISQFIEDSLHNEKEITIVSYGLWDQLIVTGRVLQVDAQLRRIKMSDPVFGYFWLPISDILDVI